jgi:hypothetical protein
MSLSCINTSECSGAQDRQLASHVLAVHRDGRAPRPEGLSDTLTPDQLRAYIAEAKQHQPFIPEDLTGAPCCWFRLQAYPCCATCAAVALPPTTGLP